jgi:DNA replication protein
MTTKMRGFTGFPAGKLPTTAVPNLFFSELLPLIDNLAELKLTLHLFWVIGHKRGGLPYARLSELLADDRLLEGLATSSRSGEAVLRDSLERATARGTLMHAAVRRGELTEEWYMVNGPHGRALLEKLRSGALDLQADVSEDITLRVDRPNVFVLYEQNIGLLTPMIAEELREAERLYPADWIASAFHEAVVLNKRNWRYVLRILERWQAEGKKDTGRRQTPAPDPKALEGYSVPEGYEGLIDH